MIPITADELQRWASILRWVGLAVTFLGLLITFGSHFIADRLIETQRAERAQAQERLEALATQDYYRSLASELRAITLSNLKAVFDGLNTPVPHVRVIAQQGSTTRYQLAQEIAELLTEAGFKSSSASMLTISSGAPTAVAVQYHAADEATVAQI